MFGLSRRNTAVSSLMAVALGLAGVVVSAPQAAHASQVGSVTFAPGSNTWTVPAGVTGAQFSVAGAAGGSETTFQGQTTPGGNGGQVTGFLPVTPGQTYSIFVGGQGQSVAGLLQLLRERWRGRLQRRRHRRQR